MESSNKVLWVFDPIHSQIRFEVRYLLLSTVGGTFLEFNGTAEVDEQSLKNSDINFQMYTRSITTGNSERDDHLRSADFFDVGKYPSITFVSTSIDENGSEKIIHGLLTIKDVQKPMTLNVNFLGTAADDHNNLKAGFYFETIISRREFNVNWNKNLLNELPLIDDEIKIIGNIQLMRVNPAQ